MIESPFYSLEEAQELQKSAKVLTGAGSFPIEIYDAKDVQKIMLKYRKLNGLGTKITIIKNPNYEENRNKGVSFRCAFSKCPYTKKYFGIYEGINKQTGNEIFRNILFDSFIDLDLNDPLDAIRWAVLRLHIDIEGTYYNKKFDAKAKLIVKDEKALTNKKVNEFELAMKLTDQIKKMPVEDKIRLCRCMSIDFERQFDLSMEENLTELENRILYFLIKNPQRVSDFLESPMRRDLELVYSAMSNDIIRYENGKGYSLKNGKVLGNSVEQVVMVVNKDKHTKETIGTLLSTTDSLINSFLHETKKAKK